MKLMIALSVAALLCAGAAFADNTAPAKVTTLHVDLTGHHSYTLEWTFTGNDCTTGDASGYEVYESTSNITDTNWQSATKVVSDNACPNGKETCVAFTKSCPATTRYYAVFLLDASGNRSPISNVVTASPSCVGTSEVECYNNEPCYDP